MTTPTPPPPTYRRRIASIAVAAMALAFVIGFTIGVLIFYPGSNPPPTSPGYIGISDEPESIRAGRPTAGTTFPRT